MHRWPYSAHYDRMEQAQELPDVGSDDVLIGEAVHAAMWRARVTQTQLSGTGCEPSITPDSGRPRPGSVTGDATRPRTGAPERALRLMGSTGYVETWLLFLAAAGLGGHTIRVRRRHLVDLAAKHPDLLAVTTADLAAWLADHAWQHSARAQARASLRLFYGWCYDEGLLERSPAWRLPKVRHPRPKSRPAPLGVIAAAIMRAEPRERRAILVARYSGLRRAEVAAIHGRDVTELGSGAPAIHVRGKGTHERLVPLHPVVAAALDGLDGYLFPSSRHPSGHLDPDTLGRYVSDLLGPGWSMHSLRHRAANDWLAVSGDILAVSKLLGHSNVAITQTYLLDDEDAMTRAVLGVAG